MVGVLLLGISVTQHPPHSLPLHKVPQSLQNLSSLPGLVETEQCHHDMSVSTVSLSGHFRAVAASPPLPCGARVTRQHCPIRMNIWGALAAVSLRGG